MNRSEICQLLWPQKSESSARHSLSQSLYTIRRQLGDIFLSRGDILQLQRVSVDIVAFLDASQRSDWVAAAKLYRGPFFAGFRSDRFLALEDWVLAQRVRLESELLPVLRGLQYGGDWRLAIQVSQRALQADQNNPKIVTALAVSLEAAGETETARATLERYTEREGIALPFVPSELQAKVEAISGATGDESKLPFVGRSAQFRELQALFESAAAGEFKAAHLVGEPGIGKTTLAHRFLRHVALKGGHSLLASGSPAEQNLPYGAVAQWIHHVTDSDLVELDRPWRDVITHAFGSGSAASSGEEIGEFQLLESLRQALLCLSAGRPLVLFIDNYQWADAASKTFCSYISRRLEDKSILLLLASRRSITPIAGESSLTPYSVIALSGLEERDVASLCSVAGRHHVDYSALLERTGGNPLLLSVLLGRPDAEARGQSPASVAGYFDRWLDEVSSDAQALVAASTLSGLALDDDGTLEIAGLSDRRTAAALNELWESGLVLKRDAASYIRHGLLAEAVMARLPPGTKRLLHGRTARVLSQQSGSSSAVIAGQYEVAGDKASAFSAALRAAAASQELYAHREREYFLKMALANAPNSERAGEVRIELAELYRRLGRLKSACEAVHARHFSQLKQKISAQAKAQRILSELASAADAPVLTTVEATVEPLQPFLDPLIVAEIFIQMARVAHELGEGPKALEATDRAMAALTGEPRDPHTLNLAASAAALTAFYRGYAGGLRATTALLSDAESSRVEVRASCLLCHASVLVAAGRLREAEDHFLVALDLIERSGVYDILFALLNNLGVCYIEQGRFDEAEPLLLRATEMGSDADARRDPALAVDNLSLLKYESGLTAEALELASANVASAKAQSARSLVCQLSIAGLAALELGRLSEAYEARRELQLVLNDFLHVDSDVSYTQGFLSRMDALEGKKDRAARRLQAAAVANEERNLLCSGRLYVELLRVDRNFQVPSWLVDALRTGGARPLVEKLDPLAPTTPPAGARPR